MPSFIGCVSPNSPDVSVKQMKEMREIADAFFKDTGILPAGKVLEMVTVDAARAIGMEDKLGSLEVGKRADIQIVEYRLSGR